MSFSPAGKLTVPPNTLTGFEGHFEAGERKGKGEEGKEKKRQEKDERDVMEKISPRNKFLVRP